MVSTDTYAELVTQHRDLQAHYDNQAVLIRMMREENDTLRAERDAARRRADAMAAELVRSDES